MSTRNLLIRRKYRSYSSERKQGFYIAKTKVKVFNLEEIDFQLKKRQYFSLLLLALFIRKMLAIV